MFPRLLLEVVCFACLSRCVDTLKNLSDSKCLLGKNERSLVVDNCVDPKLSLTECGIVVVAAFVEVNTAATETGLGNELSALSDREAWLAAVRGVTKNWT